MDSETESSKGRLATLGSVLGLGGTLVCSLSMIVAAVGLVAAGGTAAAQGSMAGTGSAHQQGQGMARMGSENRGGAANAGSGYRGGAETGAAHAPGWLGVILYVGMYAQANLALMYAAIAVGIFLLILAYVMSLRPLKREARQPAR